MKIDINILENYLENNLIQRQQHPKLPLYVWNYTPRVQYERLWDDITIKCRALITNKEGEVISKSFNKFFNIEGIIKFGNVDEFIYIVNNLNEEYYTSKKDIIEENYLKSLHYIDYEQNIINKITEIFNLNNLI